ncbi:hypothetical protein SAMN04489867_1813 [Pedococcus dokdonensis]|uniref:DUF8094 domain-containing protein n=1 Tax=Pedococcus dokdonensis TaxID=443156 RepID=A0A1H0R3E5_9MICO|nr:hypothetical protein [Pedococcus dokdonensis]SDP23498.1 hypothetical protein SAMN04489867_1813 [Pedococcus dokdonensis]
MTSRIRLTAAGALVLALTACGAGTGLVGVHDAPAQVTTTAPISPETAETIATRVLTKAAEAAAAKPADAQALRTEALTGSALAVANAASRLEAGAATAPPPLKRTDPPKVLAVSRGTAWPRLILVQTATAEGGAVLNLLVSADARTPFRLSASAPMQPGASVAALDPLGAGSPVVTDGGDLPVQPAALLKEYAASLTYPKPAAAADVNATDPFSTAIRAHAGEQAKTFGKLATLTQTHAVEPDSTVAIALKGGGALVFGLLERTDTITLRKGGKSLTPSADFQRLVRKKTLKKSATLKSYETVVFTVPADGKAGVVAVDEVLFSAKGS